MHLLVHCAPVVCAKYFALGISAHDARQAKPTVCRQSMQALRCEIAA